MPRSKLLLTEGHPRKSAFTAKSCHVTRKAWGDLFFLIESYSYRLFHGSRSSLLQRTETGPGSTGPDMSRHPRDDAGQPTRSSGHPVLFVQRSGVVLSSTFQTSSCPPTCNEASCLQTAAMGDSPSPHPAPRENSQNSSKPQELKMKLRIQILEYQH